MRILRLILFVLAALCLIGQLVRHTYVRWVEHHDSVIFKYDTLQGEIQSATSLAALEKSYAEALQKEKAEKARKEAQRARTGRPQAEEFSTERPASEKLRDAILDWERRENDIRELRFFWFSGLLLLVIAAVCQRRGWGWLALSLQMAGLAEMVWWTSPSFDLSGAHLEFKRLLDYKIFFTVLSIVSLLVLWFRGSPDLERGPTKGV